MSDQILTYPVRVKLPGGNGVVIRDAVFRASAISALTIRDFSSRPWHETTSHVVVEVHMVGSTYVHEIPIDPQLSHDEAHAEAARTIREIADSMRKAAEDFA